LATAVETPGLGTLLGKVRQHAGVAGVAKQNPFVAGRIQCRPGFVDRLANSIVVG
jgi:hypothetical protein